MRNKLVLIVLIFLESWYVFGQLPANARFIAGYPNYEYDLAGGEIDEVYIAAILKPMGDSLAEDMLLCDSLHILSFVRYYPHYHNISVILAKKNNKENTLADQGYKLIMLDTRTMDTIEMLIPKKVSAFGVEYKLSKSDFSVINDSILKYIFEYVNFNLPKGFYGNRINNYILNPHDQSLILSNPVKYRSIIAGGSSVTPYLFNNHSGDGLMLQADVKNDVLRIASALEVDSIYPVKLPDGFKIPTPYGATIIINNPNVEVMYFYEHTDTTVTCRIYDKKTEKWDKLTIRRVNNGKLIIKNFEEWLVGCNGVSMSNPNPEVKKLVGQENWLKENTKYSPSVQRLLELYEHFYAEGYLYLYNINTKNYIEWNTGQADSEILLVRKDTVYYRKHDEIYLAPLLNKEKLGTSKLLIKNKYIPAIHFMFFKGE